MNRVLTAEIWKEVTKRARTAKSRQAAIAYVTKDLIGLRAGDVLIADASERAIRSGQTSAPLLRELHRNGVAIHSHKGLHSKVILLGRYAVVGSANMSDSDLTEASILTDNPAITSGIASFIAQLSTPSSKLSSKQIEALCRIKLIRTGWLNAQRKTAVKKLRRLGNTTWIIGAYELVRDPSSIEQKHIDRAYRDLNERFGANRDDYEWIRWTKGNRFSKECREGDTLIQILNPKGSKRRVVTRRLPVLLKRNESNFVRFYVGDAQRPSDKISWSRFQRVLKKAEYSRPVRPGSVHPLDPAIAEAIDRRWNRVR